MKVSVYDTWGKNRCKYSLKIGSITVKESDKVELREITIDKVSNFKKFIPIQCKVQDLRRIRK